MYVNENLRIITKNDETYPEIRFRSQNQIKAVWPYNGYAESVGVKK